MSQTPCAYRDHVVLAIATGALPIKWAFCIESHERYCRRHGYTYRLLRENPYAGLSPHWAKLQASVEYLRRGANIFIIDADAALLEGAPGFHEVLSAHPDKSIFGAHGRTGRLNSGVVFLRGGSEFHGLALLETCLAQRAASIPKRDAVTSFGENGHLIYFLRHPPFKSAFELLPPRWNRTVPPARPDDYVVHFTGPMRAWRKNWVGCTDFKHLARASEPTRKGVAHTAYRHWLHKAARFAPPVRWVLEACSMMTLRKKGLAAPPSRVRCADSAMWRYEFANEVLEHPTMILLRALVGRGARVLDCGAHVGYYSRILRELIGSEGLLLAIEAHPENAKRLRTNAAGPQVRVFEGAISDQAGEVRLHQGAGHSNHSIVHADGEGGESDVTVAGFCLDDLVEECGIETIDVMKIDIEGAELRALKGAGRLLARSPNVILVIEINPRMLSSDGFAVDDLLCHLASVGLFVRRIQDDYRLGPLGLVESSVSANYVAASKAHWRRVEAMIASPCTRKPNTGIWSFR